MFKLPIAGQIPGMNYDIYQQHFAVHQDGLEPKYKFLRAGLKDLHFCWKKIMFAKFAGKTYFLCLPNRFKTHSCWKTHDSSWFMGSLIQSLKNGCSAGGDAALERPGHLKQLRPGHPWPRLRGRCLRAQALRPLRPSGERSASRGWLGCEEMD